MARLSYLWALVLLVLSVSTCVSAVPMLTNAERLARGLPLAKPKGWITRIVNGARRSIPSEGKVLARNNHTEWRNSTHHSRQELPLVAPVAGTILVTRRDGRGSFYVSKDLSPIGLYQETADRTEALIVKLSAATAGEAPVGLQALNRDDSAYPWLGFTVGPDDFNTGNLASGSAEYVVLGGARVESDAFSVPVTLGDSTQISGKGGETDVWQYKTAANELSPQWINADGSPAKGGVLFYSTQGNFFGITSDLKAYNRAEGASKGHAVTFTFVPNAINN